MRSRVEGTTKLACFSVIAAISLLAACGGGDSTECLVWTPATRPLLVGETTRVPLGEIQGSDCAPKPDPSFTWATPDSKIVRVTPDGLILGLTPGVFHLTATRDEVVLETEGFVLPPKWSLRIFPPTAIVHVGDTVTFRVAAYDEGDHELPTVPYSIYTPEFGRPRSAERPIVDKWSYQNVLIPALFHAEMPGETTLTGVIGNQSVTATLKVE
jgi:hypothetical protein